jgi:RecB family endonuclease NucS
VRIVVATCTVDYTGRLSAHLPEATRLILVTAGGAVSIHSDARGYKPLNWMNPPCSVAEEADRWVVTNAKGERLTITMHAVHSDVAHDLGDEPGLVKDGVEATLQELLAANPGEIEAGLTLIRREHPTEIGPVDLLCADRAGATVAVEVKRVGDIDGVEQLTRYLERLDLDARLRPVRGVLAAQTIKPQARTLAHARGFRCVIIDYDRLREAGNGDMRLF